MKKKSFGLGFGLLLTFCAAIPMIVCTLITSMYIVNSSKKELTKTMNNYMYEIANANGENLYNKVSTMGKGRGLSYEVLDSFCAEKKVIGVESSYIYIVSPDKTMLWHPTREKVGLRSVSSLLPLQQKCPYILIDYRSNLIEGDDKWCRETCYVV